MVLNKDHVLTKYILNTSFHGFRYIAEPDRHWTERLFWLICCTLSWWASGILIRSAWMAYQNNAISFVVETSYSDWDTEFPSISVCEFNNEDKIAKVTNKIYGDPHDYNLDEITKELVFNNADLFYTLEMCGPQNHQIGEDCFKKNLSDFSLEVRSSCKELFRTCKWNNIEFDCCKYFKGINTDIGMCYIVNSPQTGLFWLICCTLSWWASGILIRSAWMAYQNNAISFVVETSYSDWDTEFPSISVCEFNNEDKIAKVTNKIYGDPHDYNLDEITKELVFNNADLFYTLEMCGPQNHQIGEDCFKKNLSNFSLEVRSSCKELFRTCKWNNIEFDCCKYFKGINTDIGMCYIVNSPQTGIKNSPIYKMTSNRTTGPGCLRLELNGENNVYIMGSLEVPSIITSETDFVTVTPHMQVRRTFSIKDIENRPEVMDLNIHQRKCRFAEENYLDVFPYYSYSACLMQCRKDAQLKKCGCAHHLMPNTPFEKQCSFAGLSCLQTHYQEVMVQKSPASKKRGLVCDCLSSCTEIHVSTITEGKFAFAERYSIVELSLERLPTERYKRNVVNGKLDVAVSIGSAAALFVGASFLSFVEILYYFVVQPVTDYFRKQHQQNQWNTFY